jgi:hypothetical protein
MTVTYSSLFELTDEGMRVFRQVFEGTRDESDLNPTDPSLAQRIQGTRPLDVSDWATSKDMAQAIVGACGSVSIADLLRRQGLWAWLAFILRDQVYPRLRTGERKLGEVHRWMPASVNDYQKGQRHLVRMPVLLLSSFGKDADHLLCGAPSVPGELREQLTSQQDMFHLTVQATARLLYFDESTGKLRRGSGDKRRGGSRRFAQVRKQLDVTWDLFALTPEEFLEKLPAEFDRFKGETNTDAEKHAGSGAPALEPEELEA